MEDSYKCFLENLERETRDLMKNPCAMQGGTNSFVCFLRKLVKICQIKKPTIAPDRLTANANPPAVPQRQTSTQSTPVIQLEQNDFTCEVREKSKAQQALEQNKKAAIFESLPTNVLRIIINNASDIDKSALNLTSRLFKDMLSEIPQKNGNTTDYFDYFSTIVNKLDVKSEIQMTCNLPSTNNIAPTSEQIADKWKMQLTFTRNGNDINIFMLLKCYNNTEAKFYGYSPSVQLADYYRNLKESGFSYFDGDSLYRADWYRINLVRPSRHNGPLVSVRSVLEALGKFFRLIHKPTQATRAQTPQTTQTPQQEMTATPYFTEGYRGLNDLDIHVHANLLRLVHADLKPDEREFVVKAIKKFLDTVKDKRIDTDDYALSWLKISEIFSEYPDLLHKVYPDPSGGSGGRSRKTTQKRKTTTRKKLIISRRKKPNP